jgi:hypothetical protein
MTILGAIMNKLLTFFTNKAVLFLNTLFLLWTPANLLAGDCELPSHMIYQNFTKTSHTALVTIQNLTPYIIDLVDDNFYDHLSEYDRGKIFLMAINGVPREFERTQYTRNPKDGYVSPPKPIIFAYQDSQYVDRSDWVTDHFIHYKIKHVCSIDKARKRKCGDVDFFLKLHRKTPPPSQTKLGMLGDMFQILGTIYDMCGVVLSPTSPTAWAQSVYTIYKISQGKGFPDENRFKGDNHFWIGAYATQRNGCYPGGILGVACSDSVILQTPEICGTPSTDIIVTIMAFRRKPGEDGVNKMPLTMITLTDWSHFNAAHLKVALQKTENQDQLKKELTLSTIAENFNEVGIPAVIAIADRIQTHPSDKRKQLSEAIAKIHESKKLNNQDIALMGEIADGLAIDISKMK